MPLFRDRRDRPGLLGGRSGEVIAATTAVTAVRIATMTEVTGGKTAANRAPYTGC